MSRTTPNAGSVDVAGPADGRPIVFVHGAMMTRKMWTPQREALSEEYRVIAPDLPGHGSRAGEDFDFGRAVAAIEEVIETETDGEAVVAGLSLGGYVTTAYAHRHPESVDGLVLSGSSANPVDSLAALSRAVGGITKLATRSDRLERGAERLAERWVRNRDLPKAQKEEIVSAGFYPRQFGVPGPQLAGRDFRSALSTYPGPSLLANGSRDLLNRRAEDRHAAAATDARVEVIEGAGHICNLHRPAAYTDAVRRFQRRVAQQVR